VLPLFVPEPPLRSDRVALRALREDDVAWVAAASRDPLIPRFTRVPAHNSEDQVRAFLLVQSTLRKANRELHLLATEPDGAPVGMLGLHHVDLVDRLAHVGYWTAREARGRGLTTAAVRLLAAWAFSVLGIERLELRADVDNPASQRVAERVGFQREGVLRGAEWRPDGRRSQVVYGLLVGELTSP
jgi:RimJ/RimL family protein N-acetyltransferase